MEAELEEITLVGARPSAYAARSVLLADAEPRARQWLREAIAGEFAIDEVERGQVAVELIANDFARLIVIGRRLSDMTGEQLAQRLAQQLGELAHPITVFLLADESGVTADVDESQLPVFYRLTPSMHGTRVRELVRQAVSTLPPEPPAATAVPPHIEPHVQRIAAQEDAEAAAREAIASVQALVPCKRVRCLFCDEDAGTLWPAIEGDQGDPNGTASAGVTGFAVRTGANIAVPNVGDEPLYRAAIDDPEGTAQDRLAVQPVAGLDGHVHAVLVAVRARKDPPFSANDMTTLQALAIAWAPSLQRLAMRSEVENALGDRLDSADLFRQEAIVSLMRRGARGDVVRVHPAWVRAAYWLVLASLAAMIAFASLAKVHEYASGPAIIRFTGRSDVVTFEAGTVTSLEAERGQVVKAGQPLARLHDAEQLGHLRGLETEFERKLVAYLQTPGDPAVRQSLAQIVSQRESARAGVDAKLIRAPSDGVVKEVLVHTGQRVEAGTTVMSIAEQGATEGLSLLAFVPGGQRPRLRPNQLLSLTLPGYRGARITTRVVAVSSEVLGATEARTRYLGERGGDTLPLQGTVVVVEAPLPAQTFEADGESYQLHDGMIGLAEIRLSSRTILETIIPGLSK